jgi:hypothetical protein
VRSDWQNAELTVLSQIAVHNGTEQPACFIERDDIRGLAFSQKTSAVLKSGHPGGVCR